MKRNLEERHYTATTKLKESHHQCCCLLDLNYSSNLLSCKIADIPHKLKYETILAPIFEYCFGTSDQDTIFEQPTKKEEKQYDSNIDSNIKNNLLINIDWKRDETFIYSQLFKLVWLKLSYLAAKLGLFKNREFVLKSIKNSFVWWSFRSSDKIFHSDREIVQAAVTENGSCLELASDELRNDKQIVKQAIEQNGIAFRFASEELKDDKELLFIALESWPIAFKYASERLKRNRDVVLKAVSCGLRISEVGDAFNNDRELLLIGSKVDGYSTLGFACSKLRKDIEIVIQAIQQNPIAFFYASDRLKYDRDFVKEAVKINGKCLRYAVIELQDDKEIVELALKSYPDAIYFISERLRNDTEFISKLIGKRGFEELPKEFSNDREIILESIKLNPLNLRTITDELQNDRDFILQAVKQFGMVFLNIKEEFKHDREIVMAAVSQNGEVLQYLDNQFYDDKEIILKAAETATNAFSFDSLSESLKNDREILMKCGIFFNSYPRKYQLDREIIMEVVKRNPKQVLTYVNPLVAEERVLAMRIVKQDGLLLGRLPSKYRNDRQVVSFAIQQNKEAFKFVSDELKKDTQILELYNSNN